MKRWIVVLLAGLLSMGAAGGWMAYKRHEQGRNHNLLASIRKPRRG